MARGPVSTKPAASSAGTGDTILALASPAGGGLRAILRASGPDARSLVAAVTDLGPRLGNDRAVLEGQFHDGRGTIPLLLLWMPGPRSFTREDVVEFHLPGSVPLVEAALDALLARGARLAQPGEFTRRAFASGRIDLARAEAVLALVLASTKAERRQASALLFAGVSERVRACRDLLEDLCATCAASLDFDPLDTGAVDQAALVSGIRGACLALEETLSGTERSSARAHAPKLVLAGRPSAGKSSLFNALVAGAAAGTRPVPRALVDPAPGTTRDPLSAAWNLEGLECELIDTAGDEPERMDLEVQGAGHSSITQQARVLAADHRRSADVLLWVVDSSRSTAGEIARDLPASEAPTLVACNKLDMNPEVGLALAESVRLALPHVTACAVSAYTGAGLDALRAAVRAALSVAPASQPIAPAGSGLEAQAAFHLSQAHQRALQRALERTRQGLSQLEAGASMDLIAHSLRRALDELGSLDGHSTPEDILDRIFARFCLGK